MDAVPGGVRVARVELRQFRNYVRAAAELSPGLTVVTGPNGAGKTNLLEALYFGSTGRSPRTANERELVRRGEQVARVELATEADDGRHLIEIGLGPAEGKRIRVDGRPFDSLRHAVERPLLAVFMPDRLELVKGPPATRRAHLDQFTAALWPSRAESRAAYARVLLQRNALLARVRAGAARADALHPWDAELARAGIRLMEDRREALDALRPRFAARGRELGLPAPPELRYRARSAASEPAALVDELRARLNDDVERGFTAHGPHRDEVELLCDGARLRAYGSQGQQRAALLALLFAERDVLLELRGRAPTMLLDDVMSELDATRRALLVDLLRVGDQAIVTATEPDQVPGAEDSGTAIVPVELRAGGEGVLKGSGSLSEAAAER